jgi:hypothetical protein
MVDPNVVGGDISRLVKTSPEGKILGSALAVLLKRGYPDFRPESFGCRNLRDFIRRYAKEVFETSRQGTDVVYTSAAMPTLSLEAIRSREFDAISSPPTPSRKWAIPTAVWKTFTSPNAFYRAYVNRDNGDFRVVRKVEAEPGVPWLQIQPCSSAAHLQIAREFTDDLGNELAKVELEKVLSLESWWTHYFFATRRFGVESLWSAYRRRRLHEEFEKQLRSLCVPLPLVPASKPSLPSYPSPDESLETNQLSEVKPESEADSTLRRIAIAVVRRLPESDLREVWLPLGHVLDEIGEK